jgi:hypothetical protein
MAKVIGDICAATGKYIKDGEEKSSWAKCGVLLQTDNGFRIKLDTIPVGGVEQGIWLSVFEKEGQSQGSGQKTPPPASQGVPDDDQMPF